jgi:hypothetical protein
MTISATLERPDPGALEAADSADRDEVRMGYGNCMDCGCLAFAPDDNASSSMCVCRHEYGRHY